MESTVDETGDIDTTCANAPSPATCTSVVVPSDLQHRKVLSRSVCFVLSMTNPFLELLTVSVKN